MSSIGADSAALPIREIGSFHIGDGMIRLEGLPPRARVSTRGGPVHPIDPNGEIMVGQMDVQYVHLAAPLSARQGGLKPPYTSVFRATLAVFQK